MQAMIAAGWAGVMLAAVVQAEPLVQRNTTVVPHDQPYYKARVDNAELIFPAAQQPFAEQAAGLERYIAEDYDASFGFSLDALLNVGLMSANNQVANGFSTQYPLNRQINYPGGAAAVDYFSSTSWLNTLLYHETAHNYQLNAKGSVVSRSLHAVFGNGFFMSPLVPAVIPNQFAAAFMLEGNAVMNEARHGNGGRLYSGRFDALVQAQARAGYLTLQRAFNRTLYFPYGEASYALGGSYQYYLAEQYGVDNTNQYFLNRSRYWYFPLLVNAPLRKSVGINFNRSFADWAASQRQKARGGVWSAGEPLLTSTFQVPMNRNDDSIMLLASPSAVRAPQRVQVSRQDGSLQTRASSYRSGKLFQVDDQWYSAASAYTSPWRIYQGLYDDGGHLLKGSEGRIYQGTKADGSPVYFDAASSFDQPQLYVGEQFYGQVNSTVLVHGDDLYYFVQSDDQRTLYRNRDALYQYQGYYGMVADVDSQGAVYFIANSEHGTTLYRFDGQVSRVLAEDDVVDARLLDDQQVLVAAIQADHYGYYRKTLRPQPGQPFVRQLLWDQQGETAPLHERQPLTLDRRYHSWSALRYSGTSLVLGSLTEDEDGDDEEQVHLLHSLQINFADPLQQNSVSLFSYRDEDLSQLAGLGYNNNQFFLLAGVKGYWVLDDRLDELRPPEQGRDQGLSAELRLPLYQSGYWYSELAGTYYQDYRLDEREPLAGQWSLNRTTQFGNSWLPNKLFAISGYQVEDRGGHNVGGTLALMTDLPAEFYLGARGQFSHSDGVVSQGLKQGVELARTRDWISNDPSQVVIPALEDTVYVEQVAFGEVSLSKVLNWPLYSFTVPVSLRREALHLRYRHYDIDLPPLEGLTINQGIVGLDFELLLAHNAPVQLGLEYAYSDDDTLTSRHQLSASFGFQF